MRHAWAGYRAHAWGRDELKPISAHGQDNWGGMGVTLVDSLDTLWIMGMKDEFNEAKEWVRYRCVCTSNNMRCLMLNKLSSHQVKTSLSFSRAGSVSVFETTIRELGGLLAGLHWVCFV
jgi:mannosyl-oligosaccharide alpha-1,2-mannosidase